MSTLVMKKCPECGARFQLDMNSDHAKCSYCGTVSRVASKKPKVAPPPSVQKLEPVIYVSSGGSHAAGIISAVVTFIMIGVGVSIAIYSSQRAASGGKTSFSLKNLAGSVGQGLTEHMQWVGNRQPMLADLTGDGVLDIIGWVRFLNMGGGDSYDHVAAFNAVGGTRLWDTGPIADTGQSYNCKAAIHGDKLVVGDTSGVVKAFALANGAPAWQAVVGERVERFCGGAAGQVVAHLKDKRALGIMLATGQLTPIPGKVDRDTACPVIQNDDTENGPFFTVGGGTWDANGIVNPKLEGMRSEKVIVDNATKKTLAIGYRSPGTRVPMAALYQQVKAKKKKATAVWMTGISPLNPLTLKEGAPEKAAISQGRLVIPYELQGSKAGAKLSCLDENTGRILWDVPIPHSDTGSIGGLTASMHHVFVSHWTYLDIFQLVDGAHIATIGVW